MRKSLRQLIFLFLFSSFFTINAAQAASIQWRDWSEAVFETAKKEHKLVLIYAKFNSCHWCQTMDASTFPNPAVIQLINSRYVPVKVSLEQNLPVGRRYRITQIPTLLILNEHDQVLKRVSGYSTPNEVVRELSRLSS